MAPLEARVSLPQIEILPPAGAITLPPPSTTTGPPAAVSHGRSFSSQNPSDSTASHVAEIQGRRAVASDALGVSHKRLEKAQIEICFFTLVVGEASGEKCLVQLLHARYPDG